MLTLYKYGSVWDVLDISPFCSKVEVYFRLQKIDYRAQIANAQKSPKQKLPTVRLEDRVICDSSVILAHFESISDHPLDAGMSPLELSIAQAYRALLEEKLYFVAAWIRWADDKAWMIYRPAIMQYFGQLGLPSFLHSFFAKMARKQVLKSIRAQGIGRHNPAEIDAIGTDILKAISVFLANKTYFMGEQVRTIDATAYAFLSAIIDVPMETALKQTALSLPNLREYCERMKHKIEAPT
ncbi:glutathione S-transferase family protein [Undibacterium baiyunense]|uniref:Glutathione S-transferase family protein n=1 Tax=Undibacterium baiyunense TaxID=2828731 RepID=A0A941I319_9BURK|nr:glutathione S-transferase family protein [Undibacterium baiyunense]MBR7745956.1 glutathione S-transferase family protein [Undibacterium baiyunense]